MNAFKAAIAAGKPQIGLWQALANPYTAEICAGAGFDWLLFDGEHAPNDLPLLLQQLQAVAPYPLEPVVRIADLDVAAIKQVLDIGARTLLVPMIETSGQAEQAVKATRYPPSGVRGVGSALARASRWNRRPRYLQEASDEICVLVQVESVTALQALGDIASVEGIDGVFVGPSDLAASMGHLGAPTHVEVQQAVEGAVRLIRSKGKAAGLLMADAALAKRYLEIGASFVAVGTDVTVLARGAEALAQRFVAVGGPPADGSPG